MTLNFTLTNDDYVINSLYSTSVSPISKKKRRKSRIYVPVAYLLMAIFGVLALDADTGYVLIMTTVAALWYFLYPKWEKGYYIRFFKKRVAEIYTNTGGAGSTTMTFEEKTIHCIDQIGENIINKSSLEKIVELPQLFILNITAATMIIPKNSSININEVRAYLKSTAKQLDIVYADETNWKW